MIVYGRDAEVSGFVTGLIPGCERGIATCKAIGFTDAAGDLVAGVVYHNWNPEAGVIELTAASKNRRWLTRENLRAVFDYPFSFCRLCVARIAERNDRARRIWRAFGADEYVIPGLRGPDEAEIVYTLTAAKWQQGKFNVKT